MSTILKSRELTKRPPIPETQTAEVPHQRLNEDVSNYWPGNTEGRKETFLKMWSPFAHQCIKGRKRDRLCYTFNHPQCNQPVDAQIGCCRCGQSQNTSYQNTKTKNVFGSIFRGKNTSWKLSEYIAIVESTQNVCLFFIAPFKTLNKFKRSKVCQSSNFSKKKQIKNPWMLNQYSNRFFVFDVTQIRNLILLWRFC